MQSTAKLPVIGRSDFGVDFLCNPVPMKLLVSTISLMEAQRQSLAR
jgi:hypothetical protein